MTLKRLAELFFPRVKYQFACWNPEHPHASSDPPKHTGTHWHTHTRALRYLYSGLLKYLWYDIASWKGTFFYYYY